MFVLRDMQLDHTHARADGIMQAGSYMILGGACTRCWLVLPRARALTGCALGSGVFREEDRLRR